MAGCGMVRACMARVAVDAIDGMLPLHVDSCTLHKLSLELILPTVTLVRLPMNM